MTVSVTSADSCLTQTIRLNTCSSASVISDVISALLIVQVRPLMPDVSELVPGLRPAGGPPPPPAPPPGLSFTSASSVMPMTPPTPPSLASLVSRPPPGLPAKALEEMQQISNILNAQVCVLLLRCACVNTWRFAYLFFFDSTVFAE